MDLKDRRSLERELNELKKSYRDILNSNIKLSDEIRWTKEDRERLNRRIDRAINYIKKQTKEGIIKDKRYFYSPEQANDLLEILKNDFWEGDE